MHVPPRIFVRYWDHLLVIRFLNLNHLLLVVFVAVLVHNVYIISHILHLVHWLLKLTLVVLDDHLVLLQV